VSKKLGKKACLPSVLFDTQQRSLFTEYKKTRQRVFLPSVFSLVLLFAECKKTLGKLFDTRQRVGFQQCTRAFLGAVDNYVEMESQILDKK